MTKKEAAEFLGVSSRTVETYTSRGKLTVKYRKGSKGDLAEYDPEQLQELKKEMALARQARTQGPIINSAEASIPPVPAPANAMSESSAMAATQAQQTQIAPQTIAEFLDIFRSISANLNRLTASQEAARVAQTTRETHQPMTALSQQLALSVQEAAILSGLSQYWLEDAIRDGQLPVIKKGRRRKVRREDLDSYLKHLSSAHN